MATATYIKLDVNVPIRGEVKFIAHYAEKENPNKPGTTYSAQWVLTGSWSWIVPGTDEQRHAEGKIGIDEYQLAASPIVLGLAVQDGTWDDGNPKYKWTHRGPVLLLKTKDGKKNHVSINRLDQNGQPIASQSAAGAVSPPLAASPAVPAAQPAGVAVPASVPLSTKDSHGWADLARTYKKAVEVAAWAWGVDRDAITDAAVATVFIEANKRGLSVPAPPQPLTPEQRAANIRDTVDRFSEPPAALRAAVNGDEDPDGDLPF